MMMFATLGVTPFVAAIFSHAREDSCDVWMICSRSDGVVVGACGVDSLVSVGSMLIERIIKMILPV